MADQFVAEIRVFAGNFAPLGWAFCDGTILPISQNTALFSLLGTTYGGDGRTTFGLPDLRGRAPLQYGQSPGLSLFNLGQSAGTETITLSAAQLPPHSHGLLAANSSGNASSPSGNSLAIPVTGDGTTIAEYSASPANTTLAATSIGVTGGGLPVPVRDPYVGLSFIIALQGIFPPRA